MKVIPTPRRSCPTCGAKTVEYKHRLSRPLVLGLARLAQVGGGPINIKEIGLTRNQWDNFQKLRYFGLVVQCVHDDGHRQAGVWQITKLGKDFLRGRATVHERVWTYRGERRRYEGDLITVDKVVADYQQRPEWAAESKPHTDEEDDE